MINDAFINYGVFTFDNAGKSLLTIFQILTTDKWATTMYNLMHADFSFISPIYICLLIVLGTFFLINIILAVILDSFIRVQEEELRKQFILEHLANLDGQTMVDDKL